MEVKIIILFCKIYTWLEENWFQDDLTLIYSSQIIPKRNGNFEFNFNEVFGMPKENDLKFMISNFGRFVLPIYNSY